MLKGKILGKIVFVFLLLISCRAQAQIALIDTIVVDMATDTLVKTQKELTPALNLGALRKAAQEDSTKKAQALVNKAAQEKKKSEAEALKQKRIKEKEAKDLAEKRQKEKARMEKALADKRQQEEKQLAKEKAKQSKVTNKPAEPQKEQKSTKPNANTITKTNNKTNISSSEAKDIPIPEGVEQKDNAYGTVRLAYDDLAASFLLTIPTETKMHYHKHHSEHIMLVEGEGMVLLGYKTIKLKKDELIFVTKGTPHKIINSGKRKLKVLSIQSPFYSGKDIIILE